MAKKIIPVDETLLQNLMVGGMGTAPVFQKETEEPAPAVEQKENKEDHEERKETGKRKKVLPDYKTTFLKPGNFKQRKSTYISREYQETIYKIVNHIGNKELSIGTYIDNVLTDHFNNYADTINALYESSHPTKLIK